MERETKIRFEFKSRLLPAFLLVIIFFNSNILPREKKNYYIIENSSPLIIYDFAKRILSDEEKKIFPKFSAYEIISEYDYFGDGIRTYAEVKYLGRTYYIEKQSKKEFVEHNRAGLIVVLRNCDAIGDTVKFLESFEVASYDGQSGVSIVKNDIAIRLFKFNSRYYCFNIKTKEFFIYSFLQKDENKIYAKFAPKQKDYRKERKLKELENSIIEIDNKIKKAFNYIIVQSKISFRYPYWKTKIEGNRLIAEFVYDKNLFPQGAKIVKMAFCKLQSKVMEGEFIVLKEENTIIVE